MPDNVNAAEVIWGRSVLKMKGNTVRRNGKRVAQSIIKVPKELIKLQQDVELAIDCFFVNKHIFFTTYSTKICFTTVTHLGFRTKALIWEALHATYKIYLLRGFQIVVIAGDQEFNLISHLIVNLLPAPKIDWAAASQHCGSSRGTFNFSRKKSVPSTTAYPLSGHWALWLSIWYYISLNLLMDSHKEGG